MKIFDEYPKDKFFLDDIAKNILYKFKEDIKDNKFENLYAYLNSDTFLAEEAQITEMFLNLGILPVPTISEFYVLVPKSVKTGELIYVDYYIDPNSNKDIYNKRLERAYWFYKEEEGKDYLIRNSVAKLFNNNIEEMLNNFYIKRISIRGI